MNTSDDTAIGKGGREGGREGGKVQGEGEREGGRVRKGRR